MTLLSLSIFASLTALAAPPLPASLLDAEAALSEASTTTDWRAQQQAAAIAAWQADPELADQAWSLAPRATRAGHPRFHDPALRDSGMAPVIIERLLTAEEDASTRMALVELLPRIGGEWSETLVAAYPSEAQPGVRMMMVEIARDATPEAATDLIVLGAQDAAPTVRAAAMRTIPHIIERVDDVPLRDALIDALSDEDAEVRAFAARSVGWTETVDALPALPDLLLDNSADVRLYALRSIRTLAPDQLSDTVLDSMMLDADARVVREAQRAKAP